MRKKPGKDCPRLRIKNEGIKNLTTEDTEEHREKESGTKTLWLSVFSVVYFRNRSHHGRQNTEKLPAGYLSAVRSLPKSVTIRNFCVECLRDCEKIMIRKLCHINADIFFTHMIHPQSD